MEVDRLLVPYVSAVVEEVGGERVANDPTFLLILWKQLHLLLLILVFAFDLHTHTHTQAVSVVTFKKGKQYIK